jgi:hypothetical protein
MWLGDDVLRASWSSTTPPLKALSHDRYVTFLTQVLENTVTSYSHCCTEMFTID